ncbi:hypothetical protein HDV62DRAFT_232464 [Trichoderma sp. SZMC 28011]
MDGCPCIQHVDCLYLRGYPYLLVPAAASAPGRVGGPVLCSGLFAGRGTRGQRQRRPCTQRLQALAMRLRSLAHPLAAALATGSAQLCPQAARGPPLPNPPPLAFFFPLPPVPRFLSSVFPITILAAIVSSFFSLSLVCFLSSRHSLNLRPFRFPSLFPGPFHSFGFISKACQSLLGRLRYFHSTIAFVPCKGPRPHSFFLELDAVFFLVILPVLAYL